MEARFVALILIIIVAAINGIITFYGQPKKNKIESVKEWLKWAVSKAEKELGSGTGQLKLRYVYNLAIEIYPWIVQIVSFETFKGWVDDALVWMKKETSDNKAVQEYIDPSKSPLTGEE